jgi:catecholate siderophore receptor
MRIRAISLLAALTVVSMSAASAALAQVAQPPVTRPPDRTPPSDTADTSAKSRTQALAPVTVIARSGSSASYAPPATLTATRTPTLLRDVPQSVTVVTQKLMKDQAMRGMADVVRYMPGITMGQGEGNRDQPTIRGNASTADFFVDGVRDDVQYFRDLYNVDRVEALRGSNAMVFGRGGGGGVINRAMKEARWSPLRELTMLGGSQDNRRGSLDIGQGLTSSVAGRVNAMYERSGGFRNGVTLERSGINPTMTIAPGRRGTRLVLGYERFDDRRTADRGIPSVDGRPLQTAVSTFFGDPNRSYADVRVDAATATLSHDARGRWSIRNRTRLTSYDKIYQNIFPGAVNAARDSVTISAYNNATGRRNLFNQTDLTAEVSVGPTRHVLLVGAEVGHQGTTSRRETGYFDNTATSAVVPIGNPIVERPVTFRQSATDVDNRVTNTTGSVYAADQVSLGDHWQIIAGARYERFALRYRDNRAGSTLRRTDAMVSPRIGTIFKPGELLSLYGSYSMSFLPSAGDQFASLTNVTQALEPERFSNREIGAKWDAFDRLAVTAAVYRLDRTNTRAADPADPTRTVQTGSQRTRGYELGVSGNLTDAWEMAGAYTHQDAVITSATAAARKGAAVPFVPSDALSLWSRYQLGAALGLGLGVIHQSAMYAAIDNTVTLPAFTRLDGGVYLTVWRSVQAQLNVENLLDVRYYPTAHGNNNISPGSPRAARVSVTVGF